MIIYKNLKNIFPGSGVQHCFKLYLSSTGCQSAAAGKRAESLFSVTADVMEPGTGVYKGV